MSLELTYFAFFKKIKSFLPTRKEGKKPKYAEKGSFEGSAHLQIWTNCEITDSDNIPASLDIWLVIIAGKHLNRIKSEFDETKFLKCS